MSGADAVSVAADAVRKGSKAVAVSVYAAASREKSIYQIQMMMRKWMSE